MTRSIVRIAASVALLTLAPFAGAAPGSQIATFTILPLDVPKVVAAYDKYFASPAGQKFKGRAVFQQRLADGADPASNALLMRFHSQAEQEAFAKAVADSSERKELLEAVVPLSKLVLTGRSRTLRAWGDIVDTDTVWLTIAFKVNDMAAFNAAIDAWQQSAAFKRFPGQGYLSAVGAGGFDAPTHIITLGYSSIAEMETYADGLNAEADYQKYIAAMQKSSVRLGAILSQDVKSWGPATMKSLSP